MRNLKEFSKHINFLAKKMNHLDFKKLGNAVGTIGVLFYIGCIIIMTFGGREISIKFYNSLFHGLDSTQIIRMHIPMWESAIGIIMTFILGWIFGSGIALIYNGQFKE